jgi:hypothetical protein
MCISQKSCSHEKPWGAITGNKAMAPLKRAANISSSNDKPKLRRICYDEKASHLNQVLMLSVLRDDEKGKKREAEKKN